MKAGLYRISEKAVHDLEEIWIHTESEWSEKQADRYYFLVMEAIEKAATHPSRGLKMNHLQEGYRKISVGKHLVFYRIAADGVVEIVRILHQGMDIETQID